MSLLILITQLARKIAVFSRTAFQQLERRPRQPTKPTIRTRVFGYVTRRPPIQAIVTALAGIARAQRIRIKGTARLTERFGYITRKPPIRAIRTLFFASQRAQRLRIQGRARFTEVVRTFGAVVVAVFPERIRTLFVRRRTPRVIVHLGRVFGRITRRPPIRAIRALLFASHATRRRLALRTRAILRRPARAIAFVLAFPDRIRAVLARRRQPQIRLRARFTRVFGYRTRRPPIYRIRATFARRRLPVHFLARFLRPVRTWVFSSAIPPAPDPIRGTPWPAILGSPWNAITGTHLAAIIGGAPWDPITGTPWPKVTR